MEFYKIYLQQEWNSYQTFWPNHTAVCNGRYDWRFVERRIDNSKNGKIDEWDDINGNDQIIKRTTPVKTCWWWRFLHGIYILFCENDGCNLEKSVSFGNSLRCTPDNPTLIYMNQGRTNIYRSINDSNAAHGVLIKQRNRLHDWKHLGVFSFYRQITVQ